MFRRTSKLQRIINMQLRGARSTTAGSTTYTTYPYSSKPPTDPCAPLPGKAEPPWLTEARKYRE